MPTKESSAPTMQKPRNGRLTFYHANGQATGSAAQLELRLNRGEESGYNCFFLEMARQKEAAGANGRHAARFDWENKITVKLDFTDVCEMLAVLEAMKEQAGSRKTGLYHERADASTIIAFKRAPDADAYHLNVSRKTGKDGEVQRAGITLSSVECLGLRCVLQQALFRMAFQDSMRES
jgi:hypothetical protein